MLSWSCCNQCKTSDWLLFPQNHHYIPAKLMFFRGYTWISLSVHPCVCVSVFVQNTTFCQSTGGGNKSHSLTALVLTHGLDWTRGLSPFAWLYHWSSEGNWTSQGSNQRPSFLKSCTLQTRLLKLIRLLSRNLKQYHWIHFFNCFPNDKF